MKRNLRELTMRNLTAPFIKVILGACLLITTNSIYAFVSARSQSARNPGETTSSGPSSQNRSERLKACELFVRKAWSDFNKDGTESYVENVDIKADLNSAFIDGLFGSDACGEGSDNIRCVAANIDHLAHCEAYARSLSISNYTSDLEEFSESETAPSMGANGLGCLNQPDQASQQQCLMQAQQQPPLKCVNKGPETHDFLACKRILNFIDGFAIGKQVMQMQQGYRATTHQMDLQQDYLQKVNQGEAQVTDAMAVQRDSLEKQGNLAYEMAAFDAAKAGALLSMIASAPRPGKFISETCSVDLENLQKGVKSIIGQVIAKAASTEGSNRQDIVRSLNENMQYFSYTEGEGEESGTLVLKQGADSDSICESAIGTLNGENYIFMRENQEVFDRVKGEAIKAGLEALANGMKGKLLHDQAAMVDDAMKDIDEFAPPEFPVAEALEATASECLVDPNAEGCVAPNGAGFEGFRDSGLNINMGGGAANLGSTDRASLDDDETNVNGANGPKRDLIPNEFGVVQQEGDFSNEFSDGTARAGSIKAGELAAGGGGGGGGAGGGGGGLGGGPARGPASKKQPSGKKDINIKTKGDGLATVGGRGRIGAAKKTKAANPFSKLLGKSKTAGNKTLNFRGPAQLGSKKGSLFQMISNRYNVVHSKDRLLKYEAQKGN